MNTEWKPDISGQYQSLRKLKREIESRRRELKKMEQREIAVKNCGNQNVKKPKLAANHYADKVALNDEIVRLQCAFITRLALLERDIAKITDPKIRLMLSLRCVDLLPDKRR